MRVNKRTILIVFVGIAVFLGAGVAMRGQGAGLLSRIVALHGHGR